jgi:hypothetical protein
MKLRNKHTYPEIVAGLGLGELVQSLQEAYGYMYEPLSVAKKKKAEEVIQAALNAADSNGEIDSEIFAAAMVKGLLTLITAQAETWKQEG